MASLEWSFWEGRSVLKMTLKEIILGGRCLLACECKCKGGYHTNRSPAHQGEYNRQWAQNNPTGWPSLGNFLNNYPESSGSNGTSKVPEPRFLELPDRRCTGEAKRRHQGCKKGPQHHAKAVNHPPLQHNANYNPPDMMIMPMTEIFGGSPPLVWG